jgi:NAD(P)-dependent dehydrogenase (short-subunit alcohol dehydrogenase family)
MKGLSAIVIGATGGIGSAMLRQFDKDSTINTIFAIGRSRAGDGLSDKIQWTSSDFSEASVKDVSKHLARLHKELNLHPKFIVIATGVLHDETNGIFPEKRLADLKLETSEYVFQVNCHIPMIWLQQLTQLFSRTERTAVAVLSARVGSISDNELGGWYAYRGSKSALNMMLKCFAIEVKRRFRDVSVIVFHPGTTDTRLSKPFQANVPESKLFSPDFVAERLDISLGQTNPESNIRFEDYAQARIDW